MEVAKRVSMEKSVVMLVVVVAEVIVAVAFLDLEEWPSVIAVVIAEVKHAHSAMPIQQVWSVHWKTTFAS